MQAPPSLRALAAAAPLALAALLAGSPQAAAGIVGTAVEIPHVLDQGRTLDVVFSSAVTGRTADAAVARTVAESLVGGWAGNLVGDAMADAAPARPAACRVTATATDSSGAAGSASAAVKPGVASNELKIADRVPHTMWAAGDLVHFSVLLTCTDGQRGTNVNSATMDQDEIVS